VLPRLFPEYLPAPGGYASLGMLSKDGHEMPVGLSKVRIGFERVGINCAICHTGSYRLHPGDPPTIVPTAPAHQMAPQLYVRFLIACASDPRFTADNIMAEIAKNYSLSAGDRLAYRMIIPFTRRAILRLKQQDTWMDSRPDWGKGRIDPFNPVKFRTLQQPIDATIGNSDMQPVWNLNAHAGYVYHWDGLNTNLQEVVLSSAIGDGATMKWVDRDFSRWSDTDPHTMSSLRRIQNYIGTVKPPVYPLSIDATLAAAGAAVFQGACASCHAPGGSRTGRSSTLPRSAPIRTASRCGRRHPLPPTTHTARATPGSSRTSAARKATRRFRSMDSGCERRTSITDRCRRLRSSRAG
jgi:mono/diheme cytochrome c family protein